MPLFTPHRGHVRRGVGGAGGGASPHTGLVAGLGRRHSMHYITGHGWGRRSRVGAGHWSRGRTRHGAPCTCWRRMLLQLERPAEARPLRAGTSPPASPHPPASSASPASACAKACARRVVPPSPRPARRCYSTGQTGAIGLRRQLRRHSTARRASVPPAPDLGASPRAARRVKGKTWWWRVRAQGGAAARWPSVPQTLDEAPPVQDCPRAWDLRGTSLRAHTRPVLHPCAGYNRPPCPPDNQ